MAAPKGSSYALGYGRPPKYEETEEDLKRMGDLIDDYFAHIAAEGKPPTVTGLTLHIGFADKSSLYDHRDIPYFSHVIKRALTKVESHHETNVAFGDKCTGNIFVLKNMGWKDKNDIDVTTNGKDLNAAPITQQELKAAEDQLEDEL